MSTFREMSDSYPACEIAILAKGLYMSDGYSVSVGSDSDNTEGCTCQ